MKGVLGSGDFSAEPEGDEVLLPPVRFKEEKGDRKQEDSDLNDERSLVHSSLSDKELLVSSSREGTEIQRSDGSRDEAYGGDGSTGEQNIVGFVDKGQKRRADDKEEDNIYCRKKKPKHQISDVRVRVSGRLIRSEFIVNKSEEDKANKKESEEDAAVKKGELSTEGNMDGVVKAQVEESDHSGHKRRKEIEHKRGRPSKPSDNNQIGHLTRKKLKKRGRPPKVQSCDQSDGDGGIKLEKRRGRPPKMHTNEKSDHEQRINSKKKPGRPPKLPGTNNPDEGRIRPEKKRGRPPKVHWSDQAEDEGRIKLEKRRGRPKMQEGSQSNVGRRKLKRKRGRPPEKERSTKVFGPNLNKGKDMGRYRKNEKDVTLRDNIGQNLTNFLYLEKMPPGEVTGANKFLPNRKVNCGDMETEANENSMKVTSEAVNAIQFKKNGGKEVAKTKRKDGEQSLSEAKNKVRDRIVELLLGAGWTIEYRPRNNRQYNDAVYVNPEGKTHWSVTLAYKMFKKQFESCGDDSEASNIGYPFTPIPENELSLLKRVAQNQRKDKGKRKPKRKGGERAGEVVTQKKKHKRKLQREKLHKEKLKPAENLYGKLLKGGSSSIYKQQICSGGTSQQMVPVSVRKHKRQETQMRKPCALIVRNSLKGVESTSDGYLLYEGKRTVLSWMIDLATVPLNGKVQYFNSRKTRVLLEGRIMKEGIQCNCCSEFFTISGFESHSGSKLRQPFQNLYLETGSSLLQCLVDSWKKQDESEGKGFHFVDVGSGDPNDDTCGICGDGGDLICCDGCPSTFHQSCLDIKKFPSGDWHCVYCSCKFCGMVNVAPPQRDDDDNIAQSTLCTCSLCEEKYHPSCIQEKDAANDNQSRMSYCGKKCQELFERLHALFGVKHELEDGFSWTFLHRSDIDSHVSPSEVSQRIECHSKLAVAMFVMDECFLPLLDHRSGTNLLHNIVYNFGSNFNRLNYSGFFTAILERGDEIVAAASIRIHGNQLAEMPFIGTRYMYRRQGMCRRLLGAIECALCSLNVEKLVIPAISELMETWTSVFGFKPLEASNKQKMKNMNLLVFPHVDMLQKPLLTTSFSDEKMILSDGFRTSELKEHQSMDKVADKSDQGCSLGFDLNVPDESDACTQKSNAGSSAAESCLQPLDCPLNGTSNIMGTVDHHELDEDIKCLALCTTCEMANGIDKNILSPGDRVCNTYEQSETTNESYGAVSVHVVKERTGNFSSTDNPIPLSDKINLDRHQELSLKASVENKFPCDCDSEATDCDCIAPVNQSSCGPSGDTGTRPSFSPLTGNGICTSTVGKSSLEIVVNNVYDQKVAISDDLKRSKKSVKDLGSDCQDGCTICSQNDGSNSSSSAGVVLHCASGGSNSCGTEVITV